MRGPISAMLGHLLALVIVLVVLYMLYRAASKCGKTQGGILCKLWHKID